MTKTEAAKMIATLAPQEKDEEVDGIVPVKLEESGIPDELVLNEDLLDPNFDPLALMDAEDVSSV